MKTTFRNLALASLLISGAANAELNYSYVEGGLGILSPSGQTFIGPDVRGSFAVTDDVFVFGGLSFLTDDIDYTTFHVGGGYRFALNEKTDVWGGAGIEYQEYSYPNKLGGGSFDDTGLSIRGGLRHQLNQDIEVGGAVRIVTGDLDYTAFGGHARYKLNDALHLTGNLNLSTKSRGTELFGGVTYFF